MVPRSDSAWTCGCWRLTVKREVRAARGICGRFKSIVSEPLVPFISLSKRNMPCGFQNGELIGVNNPVEVTEGLLPNRKMIDFRSEKFEEMRNPAHHGHSLRVIVVILLFIASIRGRWCGWLSCRSSVKCLLLRRQWHGRLRRRMAYSRLQNYCAHPHVE